MTNFVLAAKATYDGSAITAGATENQADLARLGNAYQQTGAQGIAGGKMAAQGAALAKHEVTNLSYQMNDIAMMLATGQSPFVLMMQQGSQVAQIMGNRGLSQIIPALATGVMSLITPTTLFLAGITAVGYAGSAIFSAMRGDIADVDELFKQHDETIRALKDAYGEAIGGVEEYGTKSIAVMQTLLRADLVKLREVIRTEAQGIAGEFAQVFDDRLMGGSWRTEAAEGFEAFLEPIRKLREEAYFGTPDIKAFQDAIGAIAAKSGSEELAELARKLIDASNEAAGAESRLRSAQDAIEGLGGAAAASALQLADYNKAMTALSQMALPNAPADIAKRRFDEAIGHAGSPMEVEAAYAEYDAAVKRIEQREAEAAAKRAANKKPPKDWGASITGRQQDDLERIRLETQLIGANDNARAQAIATMEAEQEIRRRGIDARSQEAAAIRENARAIAEEEAQLKKSQDAWSLVENTASSAFDGLADALTGQRQDIKEVLEQIANDFLKMAMKLAVLNPLMNLLFGSGLPTLGDLGGKLGSLFSSTPSLPSGYATGGRIHGPGGPTEDKVPIMASNGEFMVNASATARHLPLLEAINDNRLPGFAAGGRIVAGPSAMPAYMATDGGARVNLTIKNYNNSGITTKETRDQDGGVNLEVILEQVDQRIGQNIGEGKYDGQFGQRYGAAPGRRN